MSEVNEELKEFQIHTMKYQTRLTKKFENRIPWTKPNPNEIHSVIPGTIIEIKVKEGQKVEQGDSLLILEAMKMYNNVVAPLSGTVKKIHVKPGEQLPKSFLMIELES